MESRRLRVAYKNRKACVKRKTMELSTLCDIKACTIIFGPHGDVETWPENSTEVKSIINTYKNYAKKSGKNKEAKSNDDILDGLSRDALEDLLGAIDSKIEVATRRAEKLLKMKNEKNRASFQDEETSDEQAHFSQPLQVILPNDEDDFFNPLMQFHGGEVDSSSTDENDFFNPLRQFYGGEMHSTDENDLFNPLMQFHGSEVDSMQMYCSPLNEVIMLGSGSGSIFPKQGVSDYESFDLGFDYLDPNDAWLWN